MNNENEQNPPPQQPNDNGSNNAFPEPRNVLVTGGDIITLPCSPDSLMRLGVLLRHGPTAVSNAYMRLNTNLTTTAACRAINMIMRATNPHLTDLQFRNTVWRGNDVVWAFLHGRHLVSRITTALIDRLHLERECWSECTRDQCRRREYRRAVKKSRKPEGLSALVQPDNFVRKRRMTQQRRDALGERSLMRFLFRQMPRVRPEPVEMTRYRVFDPDEDTQETDWNAYRQIRYLHEPGHCTPHICWECDVFSVQEYFSRLFSPVDNCVEVPTFYWMAEHIHNYLFNDFGLAPDEDFPRCIVYEHPYLTCTNMYTCRLCAVLDEVCRRLRWGRRRRFVWADQIPDVPFDDGSDDDGYDSPDDGPPAVGVPQDVLPEAEVLPDPEPENDDQDLDIAWEVQGCPDFVYEGKELDFTLHCCEHKYITRSLSQRHFDEISLTFCQNDRCEGSPCGYIHRCLCFTEIEDCQQLRNKYGIERTIEAMLALGELVAMVTKDTAMDFSVVDPSLVDAHDNDSEMEIDFCTQMADGDEVLEATSSVEESANITFADERPVDEVGVSSRPDQHMDIAEVPWNLNDILTREVKIDTFKWAVGDAAGKMLYTAGLPKAITDVSVLMTRNQLSFFQFLRCGVKVRIQLNGNKFLAGRAVAFFQPLSSEPVEPSIDRWSNEAIILNNCLNFNHAYLEASVSNSIVIEVPFSHLFSHFTQEVDIPYMSLIQTLGTINVTVFNVLRAAAGATTEINATVYMSLLNPELHQPRLPITKFSYVDFYKPPTPQLYTQGIEGFLKGAAGTAINTGLGIADKYTGGLVTGVGDALSGLFGFNCDKPLDPTPSLPVINRSIDALCHGAGLDRSIRLGLTNVSGKMTTESQLGFRQPEMTLEKLLQTPSRLKQVTWTTSQVTGDVLTSFSVDPSLVSRTGYTGNSLLIEPTLLAFAVRPFGLYRGGLVYTIQLVTTELHQGRIQISYVPYSGAADESSLRNANTIIMDIQEKKELSFEVPYTSPRPWLRCGSFQTGAVDQCYVTNFGFLTISVLNSLTVPSNVTTTVDLNILVRAASNFQVAVPLPLSTLSFSQPPTRYIPPFVWSRNKPTGAGRVTNGQAAYIEQIYEAGKVFYDQKKIEQIEGLDKWFYYAPVKAFIQDQDVQACAWAMSQISSFGPSTAVAEFACGLPNYSAAPEFKTQGLENFTSTRENPGPIIQITKGMRSSDSVATTISENAMDLQTVLRRFYPLVDLGIQNNVTPGYTIITIPVTPSLIWPQPDGDSVQGISNSPCTLAWYSRLFTKFTGSLRYKILYSSEKPKDVYCWHDPFSPLPAQVTTGMTPAWIQQKMAFATVCAVTHLQGAVEVEVPYFSAFDWLLTARDGTLFSQNGCLFFAIRNSSPTTISVFTSIGEDFVLEGMRAAPQVYDLTQFVASDVNDWASGEIRQRNRVYDYNGPLPGHSLDADGLPGYPVRGSTFSHDANPCQATDFRLSGFDLTTEPTVIESANTGLMTQALFNFPITLSDDVNLMLERATYSMESSLRGITEAATSSLRDVSALTVSAQDQLNNHGMISAVVGNETSSLMSTAKGIVRSYADAIGISSFVFSACKFIQNRTLESCIGMLFAACFMLNLHLNEVLNFLNGVLNDVAEGSWPEATYTANAQGLSDDVRTFIGDNFQNVQWVLAALATAFYAWTFSKLPSLKTMKKFIQKFIEGDGEEKTDTEKDLKAQSATLVDSLRNVHFATLGFGAISKTFDKMMEWIGKALAWFSGCEDPETLARTMVQEKADEILVWLDEIQRMDNDEEIVKAYTDVDAHNKYYWAVQKGNDFLSYCFRNDIPNKFVVIVKAGRDAALKLVKRLEKETPFVGIRYDPFFVKLDGDTGTGKTRFMLELNKMFQEELALPQYNLLYSVEATDKFHSGYNYQPILNWDEYLQCPELDLKYADVMGMRGQTEKKLNMSESEDKGRRFVSKVCIFTTNTGFVSTNAVRDNNALKERFHVVVGMQHLSGSDRQTLQKAPDFDPDYTHCVKSILEPKTGNIIKAKQTMSEIKDYIRQEFREWHEKQTREMEAYFIENGMARLPRGVVAQFVAPEMVAGENMEEDLDDALEFVDAIDDEPERNYPQVLDARGVRFVRVAHFAELSEDEQIEAELFLAQAEDLTPFETNLLADISQHRVAPRHFYGVVRQQFVGVCQRVRQSCEQLYLKYPNLIKFTGLSLALLGTVKVAASFLMGNSEKPGMVDLGEISKNLVDPMIAVSDVSEAGKYDTGPKMAQRSITKAQGTNDEQAMRITENKINPYISIIAWENGSAMMRGFWIGGKVILVPYHFFIRAKEEDILLVFRGADGVKTRFSKNNLEHLAGKDWCLYYMGAQHPSRRLGLKYFISEENLSKIPECAAVLAGLNPNGVATEKIVQAKRVASRKYRDPHDVVYEQIGWDYRAHTLDGECGSVLVGTTSTIAPPGKILGIHVAGSPKNVSGFAVLITQEQITSCYDSLCLRVGEQVIGMPLVPEVLTEEENIAQMRIVPEGSYSIYGVMPADKCPSQPQKTSLVETPFCGEVYPVTKKPAELKANERGSPLKIALRKYGVLTTPFPHADVKLAVEDTIQETLTALKGPREKRKLETKEAILGIDGDPFVQRLNMSTSPGWPYQLRRPQHVDGKGFLFDQETGQILDKDLETALALRLENAKDGKRTPSVWRDCLKDELRPKEKVEANKTRLFVMAPVDFTILVRQYFGMFIAAFYESNCKFYSAVGINPESKEWTDMYNFLRTYSDKCVAGDFSGYDGTLMAELMASFADVVNAWYDDGEENSRIRRVLMDEMIHTHHLVLNCVYASHQGNKSGNPLTVILNCWVNNLYMKLTWLQIFRNNTSMRLLDKFRENVRILTYGDDNLLAIKDEVIDEYNQVTIAECLAQFGIVYTDESKNAVLRAWKPLDECTFLKRGFRVDPEIGNTWKLPTMDKQTLYNFLNWYRKAEDVEVQLQENMRSALQFAFFHGRKFYDDYLQKYTVAMRAAEMAPVIIQYDELRNQFVDDLTGMKPSGEKRQLLSDFNGEFLE